MDLWRCSAVCFSTTERRSKTTRQQLCMTALSHCEPKTDRKQTWSHQALKIPGHLCPDFIQLRGCWAETLPCVLFINSRHLHRDLSSCCLRTTGVTECHFDLHEILKAHCVSNPVMSEGIKPSFSISQLLNLLKRGMLWSLSGPSSVLCTKVFTGLMWSLLSQFYTTVAHVAAHCV